ncbi:MAG TPA: iron ABC transporter permease, partial [Candidatus Acidoferrales bacterium]|nr:iron ABC transporter permease [Candidatus Acidoferrales bacterium]
MRALRREPSLLVVLLLCVGLLLAFVLYPQVQVVVVPGLGGYRDFFLDPFNWRQPLLNSLQVMALSTPSAVVLGFVYAYAMVYSDMPWKPFFRVIGILPLLSPPFVVAASYILLFGPRGVISYGLFGVSPDVLGLGGIWGVQTIAFFPFAYQLIADVLARSDPRLEQAARNLGAGAWRIFWTVTFPLARPGLLAAALTTAIYVLEDFGNPALIGGRFTVLPTQAYGLISGFGDFVGAAAVSTILLVLALVLYLVKLRLEGRSGFVTVSGRASSMPRPPVPAVVTWSCFLLCLLLAGLLVLVYGVLVVSAFATTFPSRLAPTFAHFVFVGTHSRALVNTLVFAGSAAVVCALLAGLLAFLVQRRSWPGRRAVDFLCILPAAVPGIFFGIGYATAFNQRWIADAATWLLGSADISWLLIPLSMVFWNIPVGYQAASAGLQQIDR